MPCLFVREFQGRRIARITEDVTPGCEWVLAGEGEASIKRDGTACAVIGGKFYARYDAKNGKTPPAGAIPCCDPDPTTGHWPHWIEVQGQPHLVWHREAWAKHGDVLLANGDATYELCGPKLQGNPEKFGEHVLIQHGAEIIAKPPRAFGQIADWLKDHPYEGIVFAHSDGRYAKIRRDDFGFSWPIPQVDLDGASVA